MSRTCAKGLAFFLVFLAAFLGVQQNLPAQFTFNEREIKTEQGAHDKDWTLDFRFKDPRIIQMAVPGRGTRVCWYLWYQVINRTGEPRPFIPEFELVTLDYPATYQDEILTTVQEAIAKSEDPTGYQKIKNSVSIARDLIPVSKPEAFPRAITGVAIWDGASARPKNRDPNVRDLADSTRFSIFVKGLSNSITMVDPIVAGEKPIARYKTLQLNFKREGGDRSRLDARKIEFVGPHEWIYRAGDTKINGAETKK